MSTHISLCVIGIGGGGGNAVHHIRDECAHDNIRFCAINTDAQALDSISVDTSLLIGEKITQGFGTGAQPELGRQAAEEDYGRITQLCNGSRLVFIIAGLGGGTGTGAAPIVAQAAKEMGALTVAIVTKPFGFEGETRMENAVQGLEALREQADMVICVANDRVLKNMHGNMPINAAFRMTDDVVKHTLTALHELIAQVGIINIDFNDVKYVVKEPGESMIGYGEGTGDKAVLHATRYALAAPLVERSDIIGAKRVLMSIVGSTNVTMKEVEEAVTTVKNEVRGSTHVSFGVTLLPEMKDTIRITLIATGLPQQKEKKTPAKSARNTPPHLYMEQQNFDFLPADNGLFVGIDPTLINGVNYDTPTFIRWRRKLMIQETPKVVATA